MAEETIDGVEITPELLKKELTQVEGQLAQLNEYKKALIWHLFKMPDEKVKWESPLEKLQAQSDLVKPTFDLPITVTAISTEHDPAVQSPVFGKAGAWVAVRLVDEEHAGKTYLGVLLGEIPLGAGIQFNRESGVLRVRKTMYNPAIWIPDLNKVAFGVGSWWEVIETPEDLKQISNQDIENTWYVKALKDLQEKGAEPAPAEA